MLEKIKKSKIVQDTRGQTTKDRKDPIRQTARIKRIEPWILWIQRHTAIFPGIHF